MIRAVQAEVIMEISTPCFRASMPVSYTHLVIQNYEPPCEMEQRGNSSGFLGSNGIGNYKATKGRVNRSQEEPGQENISREITEECLAQAMEQAGGNKTKAARILGIHRSTIWRYIKKFGME